MGKESFGKIGYDGNSCSMSTFKIYEDIVGHEKLVNLAGPKFPVSKLRIIKNQIEVDGLREALKTESAALIRTYAQLKDLVETGKGFYEH